MGYKNMKNLSHKLMSICRSFADARVQPVNKTTWLLNLFSYSHLPQLPTPKNCHPERSVRQNVQLKDLLILIRNLNKKLPTSTINHTKQWLTIITISMIFLTGYAKATANCQQNNDYRDILVFISFSMPESLLLDYLNSKDNQQVTFVLRGLKNNSFKQTLSALKSLQLKANQQQHIIIDPFLFKQFNINKVPAFVRSEPNNSKNFDVIYGATTIEQALQTIYREQQ